MSQTLIALHAALLWTAPTMPAPLPTSSGTSRAVETCDGRSITRVEIVRSARQMLERAHVPGGLRQLVAPLLIGTPSRSNSITPWLLLRAGQECTEWRRAESERLLRTLPYIADATVSVVEEGNGVAIVVETVDDLRPIIGLGVRGAAVTSAELGSTSIDGSGQLASVRWQDGRAYRDGFGLRYTHYHALGGPNLASLVAQRAPQGSVLSATLTRPFASSVQRLAAFTGVSREDDYVRFVRESDEPLAVAVRRERADIGFASRVTSASRETWLLGAVMGWDRRRVDGQAVSLTDTGRVAVPNTELDNRFADGEAFRVGVAGGLRALSFAKARAFDGLEAVQDVARGAQLLLQVGRSLQGTEVGPFVRGDLFLGVGTASSYLGLQLRGDARRVGSDFRESVLSGRLAWYARPTERQTRVWSAEYTGASTARVPYQLSFGDDETGLRGYRASRVGGGRRLVLRAERRLLLPSLGESLASGVAAFTDVGQLWAGGVPFGVNAFRAGAGISLLAAVPRRSRSVARVDLAYPLVPDAQAKGLDVRVTYRLASRLFWREPGAIARARLAAPTSDVFSWP